MHKTLFYAAYGWLAVTGTLHFAVDVVSQYARAKRSPGIEANLYYGLNTAYSLGQLAFGLIGLFLAWRAFALLDEVLVRLLSLAAGLGWLALTFLFMEYWEPKFAAGVFCALLMGAWVTR